MWITIIPVTIIAIYLTKRLLYNSKRKLLREIQIGTVDGYYYNIEVNTFQYQKNPVDAKRLTIGFLVAILRHTQKNFPQEFQDILKFLREVSKAALDPKRINDYFLREFAFELYVRNESVEDKGKVIRGKYYLLAENKRQFVADIPGGNFKYQFLFSMGSLVNSLVNYLDTDRREKFRLSILHILSTLEKSEAKKVSEVLKTLENDAWQVANRADASRAYSA